jgi:hypothetical protein
LKSLPRATGTPALMKARAGGARNRSMYAVVGSNTATVPAAAIAAMPAGDT